MKWNLNYNPSVSHSPSRSAILILAPSSSTTFDSVINPPGYTSESLDVSSNSPRSIHSYSRYTPAVYNFSRRLLVEIETTPRLSRERRRPARTAQETHSDRTRSAQATESLGSRTFSR